MISKNKNLFLKIYIFFLIITIITLIILQILGSKNRVGYLTDFSLVVDKTMKLKNSENITNYVYHFRIMYYDKVFRHNDIYGVYPDLSNLPDFVKEIKMDYDGSPFGIFISDKKIIEEDKIDNINYTLKIKKSIINIVIFLYLSILILYLTNYLIKYFIINNKIHFTKIDYQNKFYNLINKKYILYSFLFLILLFSLFVRIYWASKQEGMYWDEYYSLSAANYGTFANGDKINSYKNVKGFDILKNLTFDNSSIEDCINDIKRLYKDTNDPFISNLYYTFLRLAFIGREAVDIKNIIITGTILNCIFSIISFIFLFKILKLIFENKNEFIIFPLLIFSLSPISISFSMFLRAYQMQETFFIVITYFVLNTIYYNKYSILNLILTSIIAGIGYLTLYSSLLFILILSAMLFFNYCLNIDKLEFLKNKYAILNLLKIKSYKIIIYYALAFISALFVSRILYNSFFASLFNANNRASSSLAFSGKLFNYINDLAFDGLLIILLALFVFILISKIIKKKDLNIIAEKSKFKLLIFIILLGLIFAILGDLTSPFKLERYSASSYIFILFFIPLIICFITNLKIRIILLSLISIIYIFNITNSKRFVYFEVVDKDKYVLTNNYNVYAYKVFFNHYGYAYEYLNTNLYYTYLNDSNELNSIKENNFYLMIDYKDIDKIKNELTDYNFNYLNNVGEITIFELNKKFN